MRVYNGTTPTAWDAGISPNSGATPRGSWGILFLNLVVPIIVREKDCIWTPATIGKIEDSHPLTAFS